MSRETIRLQYPVTFDGEEITELHLRRPKLSDLKRLQRYKDNLEKTIHMVADLAEVSPKLIEELDAEDFTILGEWVGNCIPKSEGAIR